MRSFRVLLVVAVNHACSFDANGIAMSNVDAPPFDAPMIDASPDALPTAANCAELHMTNPSGATGLYTVMIGTDSVQVYCEMSTLGGGWTLVQRTVWDFTQSSQLMTNYARFFASTIGSTAPDSAYRLAAKYWPAVSPGREHLVVHRPRATSGTRCAPLYYTATGLWSIPLSGPAMVSGVTQNAVIFDSNTISTTDQGPSQFCVNQNSGVPWTYANCCHTCPTYGDVYFSPPRPAAVYLATPDEFNHTISDSCGSQSPVYNTGLYADDVMEYYAR